MIVMAEPSRWQKDSTANSFATNCGEGEIAVGLDRLLASDGSTYFFLAIPISHADALDQNYDGITLYARYPKIHTECSVTDVKAIVNDTVLYPEKAVEATEKSASCLYRFNAPIEDSGSLSFNFEGVDVCDVPDLNFKYKTDLKYNYDGVQG